MADYPIDDPMRPGDPLMFSLKTGTKVTATHPDWNETFTGKVLLTGFDGERGEYVELDTGTELVVIRLGLGFEFLEH